MWTLWNKIPFINNSLKFLWSEVWKGMLILGLLVMYFDAAVVFVKKTSLLFRLALTTLKFLKRVYRKYFHHFATLLKTG